MSGSSGSRRWARGGWLCACLLAAGPAAPDEAPADPALLEFLAAWETEDEDWFDVAIEDETDAAGEGRPTTTVRPEEERDDEAD